MRILIAEDDRISAKVLQRSLEALNYEPEVVFNGLDAWDAVQNESYSVLITDWMMPGLEGPELCKKIREQPSEKYTYIIMLTARGEKSDRTFAMESGADDFLSKPLDRQELESRLAVADRILQMQKRLESQNESLLAQQAQLVSARNQAERISVKAELASNRFSQLFDGLPLPCFTFDLDFQIREQNQEAAALFALQMHELVDKSVFDLFGAGFITSNARRKIRSIREGKRFSRFEISNGEKFYEISCHPLVSPENSVYGGLCIIIDNTELRRLQKIIEEKATTDGLTNIPNRRLLESRLNQLISEAKRGRKFSLVMLDVDFFKKFNDEFGHQAGDEVLKAVAKTLKDSIREVDFAARFGGEEFCALLVDTDEAQATELIERTRIAIQQIENPYRQITASFGVATFTPQLSHPTALLKAADEALYVAKQQGRNRVVPASSVPEPKAA